MRLVRAENLDYRAPRLGHRSRGKGAEDTNEDGGEKTIAFKVLLTGTEGTPENYMFALSRQGAFYSPPHKHNFDQFRYACRGDFSIGPNVTLREGQLGYFPEGTPYGPQDDMPGERELLVLQFGGVSGQGYMSQAELRAATEELKAVGHFADGKFHRERGEGKPVQDGYEALWEHHNKRPLDYPAPRYKSPVLLSPNNFGWIAANEDASVSSKTLGVFTERQTRAEMVKFTRAADYVLESEPAIRLVFVLSGSGRIGSDGWREQTAIELGPDESGTIHADGPAQLLVFVTPLLSALGQQGRYSEPERKIA